MTPEQRFARWVRLAIIAFVVMFAYFVIADAFMPLTPQVRVLRPVVPIAPDLSGRVTQVVVTNNQAVEQGDTLFHLDAEPHRIAFERAQLAREEAQQENARLKAQLAAAGASLTAARTEADELSRERRRSQTLVAQQGLSRQQYEQRVAEHRSAVARVEAAEANIQALEVQLGEEGSTNLRLRQADNALANASLRLDRTAVVAQRDGRVTNLQLREGSYAQAGQPVMTLVGNDMDIIADFREKSLRHVSAGDPVWIVFDAWPGQVFSGHVISRDEGVLDGQLMANGKLADIPVTDRWVRDAQRLRLHLALNSPLEQTPPSGARGTVQLLPHNHVLARPFAWLQIHAMSLLHHVY